MAEIEPFRGWRYDPNLGPIEHLTSPLYDFSEHSLLQRTYQYPYNINHLFLPLNTDDAENEITHWKNDGILIQDQKPSIYVFSQSFYSHHSRSNQTNLGFICNVQLHKWEDQIILRHENVHLQSVDYRKDIIEKTKMHFSPLHGLYTDKENSLEQLLSESIKNPIYHFKDILGVENKLSIISDLKIINEFQQTIHDKQIILADGHHRYEAALEVYLEQKSSEWKFHPIYLTNTESNVFEIFPIYRLLSNLLDFDHSKVIEKLNKFFSVEFIEEPFIMEKLVEQTHTFGIIFKDKYLVLKLKPESLTLIKNKDEEIKNLDLTVLNSLIIEKSFGLEGIEKKKQQNVNFSFNFTKSVLQVQSGEFQAGIILKPITIDEVKNVCYKGLTLPYKSTYFFPKTVCGLVSTSLNKEHFDINKRN